MNIADRYMVRRSDIDVFSGERLDAIGKKLLRGRHNLADPQYREVLRATAMEQGRYEDDLGPLPKRVPPPLSPRDSDVVDAAKVAHRATHPLLHGDVLDCGATVIHIPEGPRVQDLLENGNLLLEEKRAEMRAHDRTREELAVWKERALTYRAALRRVDPVWLGEEG